MTLKKKIIVAMSGGVDSSVAAVLLASEGHDVVGVTLKLLPRGGEGFGCCGSPEDVSIAKRSAEKAGIPHYVLDYAADFDKNVVNYFVDSYISGETPNPCLACNRHIKFDKLKEFATSLEATHLATGHYARIEDGQRLFEANDPGKDQSYVLYNLKKNALATTLFPVGTKPKNEIRAIAKKFDLPNWDKEDSQEICFVPNKDVNSFLQKKIQIRSEVIPTTTRPGYIKDQTGRVLGTHEGVAYYTIGQRKGLGLTTKKPVYVTRLEPATNTVVVGSDAEGFSQGLKANDLSWVQGTPPAAEFPALVKIRYKHTPTPCVVSVEDSTFSVRFADPQRAVTPGQAAVLYRWDERYKAREVLGGGKITHAL